MSYRNPKIVERWHTSKRETQRNFIEQIKSYGIDPENEVLILCVILLDETKEYRAFNYSSPYYDADLKAMGFRWSSRGFWTTENSFNVLRPEVFKVLDSKENMYPRIDK
jgi:hypothetical protein